MIRTLWLLTLIPLLLTGCAAPTTPAPTAAPSPRPPTATLTPAPTPTITPTPTPDPAVLAFMAGLEDLSAPWGVVETEGGATYLVPLTGLEGETPPLAPVTDKTAWQMRENALWYGEQQIGVFVPGPGLQTAADGETLPLERLAWEPLKVVVAWQEDGLHVERQEALAALVARDEAGFARQVWVEGERLEVPRSQLRDLVETDGEVSIEDIVATTPDDWRDFPEMDWRVWGYWVEENNAMMEALIEKMGYEAENFKQAMIMMSRRAKLWGTPLNTYPFWTASAWEKGEFVTGVRLMVEGKELVVISHPSVIDARRADGELEKKLVIFNLTFDPEVLAKVAEGHEGAMTMDKLWIAVRNGEQVALGVMGGAIMPVQHLGQERYDEYVQMFLDWQLEYLHRVAAVNNGEWNGCAWSIEEGKEVCAEVDRRFGGILGVVVTKSPYWLNDADLDEFNRLPIPVVGAGR